MFVSHYRDVLSRVSFPPWHHITRHRDGDRKPHRNGYRQGRSDRVSDQFLRQRPYRDFYSWVLNTDMFIFISYWYWVVFTLTRFASVSNNNKIENVETVSMFLVQAVVTSSPVLCLLEPEDPFSCSASRFPSRFSTLSATALLKCWSSQSTNRHVSR